MERMNHTLQRKLTLISAPAGFGKTTVVCKWIDDLRMTNRRVAYGDIDDWILSNNDQVESKNQEGVIANGRFIAWLSLDEADSEPTRFLTYVIAALQTIEPEVGRGALTLLQGPQPPGVELIVTAVLNDITSIFHPFILVLDDYHLIGSQAVDQALTFMLEHLPPQMHLIITTREDPPLPLPRLRVRGQLNELRAADLRFTGAETAVFLNQLMGLNLSPEAVAALDSRTEGWAAGLQLAALSMQGQANVDGFINAFAGDNRFIVDYLVEEVLQQQPPHIRDFLLQTAVLRRLNGSLCDAVRFGTVVPPNDQQPSNDLLAVLERGNLFVISLDDKRQWYRYHHLFSDVLQTRAREEPAINISQVHRRASRWYAENGQIADAIRHALTAPDFEQAANFIELAYPEMDGQFLLGTWRTWLEALPEEMLSIRPVLQLDYAWSLLNAGEMETAAHYLQMAEQGAARPAEMKIIDEEQFQGLPASIATARAYLAQALGDGAASILHAKKALDLLPASDDLRRGPAAALLGLAYWANGELEAAYAGLASAMAGFRAAGHLPFALSGVYGLADIRLAQGRLYTAVDIYKQGLRLANTSNEPLLQGLPNLHLGLGAIYYEQGKDEAAADHLQKSEELGQKSVMLDWPYRRSRTRAQMKAADGSWTAALALLDDAEQLFYRSPLPEVRPILAEKARIWIWQGRLAEAEMWAKSQQVTMSDELTYLREYEHITLVRLRIAQSPDAPMRVKISVFLDKLLEAAEAGGRMGSVLELLLVQAMAHQAQENTSLAMASLTRALALAAPEGYVRRFAAEGDPLLGLLREAKKRAIFPEYVTKLLPFFEAKTAVNARPVPDPLSKRELEVLKMLATDLSGPEIANRLIISLNTMRTHTKNIYSKLGVNSRRTAVRRAQELHII